MNTHLYESYKDIEDIINDRGDSDNNDLLEKEETYQKLMNKEDTVLNLLNDMSEKKREKESKYQYMVSSPVHVVVYRVFNSILDIIKEASEKETYDELFVVIFRKDRIVYLGIFIVVVSLVLMLTIV
jgi:hypothetical protein